MRAATEEKLSRMYYDGVPKYIKDATRNKVVIRCDGGDHTITMDDVVRYYAYEACNMMSGCRMLGDIGGDWRTVDAIAKECLEIFKVLNVKGLRRTCKPYSDIMTPRF